MPLKKIFGFTLIEVMISVGIIAILAVIVIVAINPVRQFANAHNNQRQIDLVNLNKSLVEFSLKNGVPNDITLTPKQIGTSANIDLTRLTPNYLSNMPTDPSGGDSTLTGYYVYKDKNNCIIVYAANAELDKRISAGCSPNYTIDFNNTGDTDDVVVVPANGNYVNLPSTWIAWVKIGKQPASHSGGGSEIIGRHTWDGVGGGGFSLIMRNPVNDPPGNAIDGTVGLEIKNASGTLVVPANLGTAKKINDSTWHQVAGVVAANGGTAKIYIDPTALSTPDLSIPVTGAWSFDPSATLRFGGGTPNDPSYTRDSWLGQIDDVKTYNRELTPAQIAALAVNPSDDLGIPGNNTGFWSFNEGAGLTVIDSSGIRNNGTFKSLRVPLVRPFNIRN